MISSIFYKILHPEYQDDNERIIIESFNRLYAFFDNKCIDEQFDFEKAQLMGEIKYFHWRKRFRGKLEDEYLNLYKKQIVSKPELRKIINHPSNLKSFRIDYLPCYCVSRFMAAYQTILSQKTIDVNIPQELVYLKKILATHCNYFIEQPEKVLLFGRALCCIAKGVYSFSKIHEQLGVVLGGASLYTFKQVERTVKGGDTKKEIAVQKHITAAKEMQSANNWTAQRTAERYIKKHERELKELGIKTAATLKRRLSENNTKRSANAKRDENAGLPILPVYPEHIIQTLNNWLKASCSDNTDFSTEQFEN